MYLQQSNSEGREQDGGFRGLGGGENEELLFNGYKVTVTQDEKVLDLLYNIVLIVNKTAPYT